MSPTPVGRSTRPTTSRRRPRRRAGGSPKSADCARSRSRTISYLVLATSPVLRDHVAMRRSRLAALSAIVLVALAAPVAADDSWMGWQTLPDGQSNGIDVSFVRTSAGTCPRGKSYVVANPRFKNRYTERVAGQLEVVYEDASGTHTATADFALEPNETKVIEASAICRDTNRAMKLALVGLRFPDREAEQ